MLNDFRTVTPDASGGHAGRLRLLARPLPSALMLPALLLMLAGCATPAADLPPAVMTAPVAAALTPEEADYQLVRGEAEAGNPDSQLLLAEKLLAGIGTPRDIAQARLWLEKAAAQEYPAALDVLATLYYRGIGVAVDYANARKLMERAVAHNYLPAINNLAWFLATCPDAAVRDGARAVALLEPVMDQSAQMQDTLAAAYAETGNFEWASALQKQAIFALENADDERLPEFVERLNSYANGNPWRDPASTPSQ